MPNWFDRDARAAALISYAIWALVWAIYHVTEPLAGHVTPLAQAPVEIASMLLVATIAFALYPLIKATMGWRWSARWLLLGGAVVIAAMLQTMVNVTGLFQQRVWLQPDGTVPIPVVQNLRAQIYLTFANVAVLAVMLGERRRAAADIRAAQAEAAAERARLTALRLQLNPHFLFNSLNALSSLVVAGRRDDAEEMLARLVEFLRASLAADPNAIVALDDEVAAIETYLAIEAVRFGERLIVEIDVARPLGQAAVPSFILQPLVENAVKYGVARSTTPVTVRLRGAAEAGVLALTVDDDGPEAPVAVEPGRAGMGVGLANVRARLAALHGLSAGMEKARVDGRFTVTLRLPLAMHE